MECPECQSTHIRKNGIRRGKQNHICADYGPQFIKNPKIHRGYSDDVRQLCLRMIVNGMGYRGVERVTNVYHTRLLRWHRLVGELLPNAYEGEEIPRVSKLDEREIFVGKKAARPLVAEWRKGMLAKAQ